MFVSSYYTGCENAAGTSPMVQDCYAALSTIPQTEQAVTVRRDSASAIDAGKFRKAIYLLSRSLVAIIRGYLRQRGHGSDTCLFTGSNTCLIQVSDYTPTSYKFIYPHLKIPWGKVYNETGMNLAMCSTSGAEGAITGGVVILGRT